MMTKISLALAVRRSLFAFAFALAPIWVWADEPGSSAVTLSLHAPHAKTVEITGDFNQWQSGTTPLAGPDDKGMWRVVLMLPGGSRRIEYVFWVDGSRVVDPLQPVVKDGFSGENNVLLLP